MKNIAVIGAGYWGKNLIRNFYELGVLKYIFDESLDARTQQQDIYGIADADFESILADSEIQGVVISTPAHTHYEIAKDCLLKGKNVFIEKPICLNLVDALDLKKISEDKDKILMVGHLLNYHNHFIKLLNIVDKNMLGNLIRIKSSRKSYGKLRENENVIWSFAPHDISMINRIVKGEIKNLSVQKNSYFNSNCDSAFISYNQSGVKIEIDVDWASITKKHKLEVFFSDGILVFEDSEQDENHKLYLIKTKFEKDNLMIKNKLEKEYIVVEESQPLLNECKHFLECMKDNKKPITDSDESINVLKILIATDEF
tara:strand:- start:2853 stop:3794 length:942 start_codon:yes stop_codon:yes gene_type:complete